jgi:FO synthase
MSGDLIRHLVDAPLEELMKEARHVRDAVKPSLLTYSRKVFIPLTMLCRNVCHYCAFAKPPRLLAAPYMTPDQALAVARAGVAAGCKEALLTLGDRPEDRYAAAREALAELGFASTAEYVAHVAGRILDETGLLPHVNAGVLSFEDLGTFRSVAASAGLMLESSVARLCAPGGPHHGSPDKRPELRLGAIEAAGRARVPFTTGLLIGIGETPVERVEALLAIRALHDRHGHIQEVIVQNFKPKPGTRMAGAPEPSEPELLRTIAMARIVMGGAVGVQTPPNLNPGRTAALIGAGLDDWGGISPLTPDHVNPEAPWPEIAALEAECAAAGRTLAERLTVYPAYLSGDWIDSRVAPAVLRLSAADGLAREDSWSPGAAVPAPCQPSRPLGAMAPVIARSAHVSRSIARAAARQSLSPEEIADLLAARGGAADEVVRAADEIRRKVKGEDVTYVVNRNINYTNICTFSCGFCAFSKSSSRLGGRDRPYDLPLAEIKSRIAEAWSRGATEVCLQGGIHPRYDGATYLAILRAVKDAQPGIHVHAFSPLEIAHGAETLGMPAERFLRMLKDAGLGSLPGTAAEILDDEIRQIICPDKLATRAWLDVVGAAHAIGLPTTATIMFGHVERPIHSARHLSLIREQQLRTGGFTELVPLPFVHMAAPLYVKGLARRGPTWREAVLMHAVARIALQGAIGSIQASWVKLGLRGAAACLEAGANDLGGVLMNESISRAAGASHGQELDLGALGRVADALGRPLRQRTTLYGPVLAGAEHPRQAGAAAPARGVPRGRPSPEQAIAGTWDGRN